MRDTEFVVILTEDRNFGKIFLPYLIRKKINFYSIERHVSLHDLEHSGIHFEPWEKKLVELMDKYSDERLMKRFSKIRNVAEFRTSITPEQYEKQLLPFIGDCMYQVVSILMVSPVRVLLKEAKYPNLYDEDELDVQPLFAQPVFHFSRLENETRYHLKVLLDGKEIPLKNRNITIITNDPCVILYRNRLIAFEKLDAKKLIPFFTKEYVSIPPSFEDKYYAGFIRKAIRDYEVSVSGFRIEDEYNTGHPSLTPEFNLEMKPAFVLRFHYGTEIFLFNERRAVSVKLNRADGTFVFQKITRDFSGEKQVHDRLIALGLQEKDGYFVLPEFHLQENHKLLYALVNWLNDNKPQLESMGIRVEQGKFGKNYFTGTQNLEIKTGARDDWFDVYARVTFGTFSFPFIQLKNHILNDIREFELPNGEIAVIPDEWFARYKNLMPFARKKGHVMQFGKFHYPLLQHTLEPAGDSMLNALQRLSGKQEAVGLPNGLHAELRNYQKKGFQWLAGLHRHGFGGCLADDMGLGKTLQTLALLLKFRRNEQQSVFQESAGKDGQLNLFSGNRPEHQNPEAQPASLIVLPTSLVHNWASEIIKFAPGLKIYKHTGANRKVNGELKRAAAFYDIILTTYGTVRNDEETLSALHFYYLILDESQYVKNPASKTYKAVMKLQGAHRLVLTGTPVENSLSDLWAQMHFLNPGILGSYSFFKRFFITPIEKHQHSGQQQKLQIMIRPFILRRTKEEVARDLPPLMEQVVICAMEEEQERIYEKEKSLIRNSILAGIEQDGMNKSGTIILQGLTRLRQLANHPLLLDDMEYAESGKYGEIIRMLESIVAEKHKVLVFSSFVKHLELIRARIEKEKWKYSMLTGQTINREEVIQRFQHDRETRIFLISLKAGGVGLNLTGADYVFIIDPWWNPAAENQAVSRAHRIGQNRHVFVYRFITQGSIEEKIRQLQQRKSTLADRFIHSNNPLKEITKEEVSRLFD